MCTKCGKPAVGRRLCRAHYQMWWKNTPKEERTPASNLKFKSIEERFWEKVDRRGSDECWPWMNSTARGYGEFYVSPERGKVMAHSFAIELTTGIPCPPGQEGCHDCDNPPCCNPNPGHAYYGTHQQNVNDIYRRGRAKIGEDHPDARFTVKDIIAMREGNAAGISERELAEKYKTSTGYISHILNGKVWAHTGGPLRGQK